MCVIVMTLLAALLSLQQPETLSLLGEPLYAPKLSTEARAAADAELARAHAAYTAKPSAVPEILALARAHLALGRVGDALILLTHGLEANTDAPDLLLERGRGYIVIRKFDVAARDLSRAAPKLPEAQCSLALAQYLGADYQRARATYKDCAEPGVFAYLAERRTGGHPPQRPVPDGPPVVAAPAIKFPGSTTKEKSRAAEPLSATYLDAIERLLDGDADGARDRLGKMLDRNRSHWMETAYIAAEADYARLKPIKKKK